MTSSLSINFAPLIPELWIIAFACTLALLLIASWFRTRSGVFYRLLCGTAFIAVLLNPSIHEEQRESASRVAAIITDQSASQGFGNRADKTQAALRHIQSTLSTFDNLDVRVANAPSDGALAARSDIFSALDDVFADIPESQRAGAIFITDGQIHDAPPALQNDYGPIHTLLSGDHSERDRRITITNAPAFGIVGEKIAVTFKVEDTNIPAQQDVRVTLKAGDLPPIIEFVEVGAENTFEIPVTNAGQNVFELSVESVKDELTLTNNRAALDFQGVRDRLRVLLVSGKPHAGGRTWRDLLTADPSVDLVHFTILREPDKIDGTPQNEMSLIAFPFRELFELKLYDFDLIIFDRYKLSRILPDHYFRNIARYVQSGGAFLEASGPSYAGEDSIYYTALNDILPGKPTSTIYEQRYTPALTKKGRTHPVTRDLGAGDQNWGAWLRQVELNPVRGDILMDGVNKAPLLALNRVGDGRVAQIASDQVWLWARGYNGGGPHTELLRRTVHWLMKEPELDERALSVLVDGTSITVKRADYDGAARDVTMTNPDGDASSLTLQGDDSGFLSTSINANQNGIYSFAATDSDKRFAIVGELNPLEYQDVLTTEDKMQAVATESGGQILWLEDTPKPAIRRLKDSRNYGGRGWIGLRDTDAYTVVGAKEKPILPLWVSALLLLSLIILAWWREGRRA